MQLSDTVKAAFTEIINEVLSNESNRVNAYQARPYRWVLSEKSSNGFNILAKKGKIRGKDAYNFSVIYSESLPVDSMVELEATAVIYSMEDVDTAKLRKFEELSKFSKNAKIYFPDSSGIEKIAKIEELMKKLGYKYEVSRYENSVTACLKVFGDVRYDEARNLGPRSDMYEIDNFLECLEQDAKELEEELAEKTRIENFVKNLTPQMRADIKKAMELKILG